MKINIIKTLAAIVIVGSIMIPAVTFAAMGLEGEGQGQGGATVGLPEGAAEGQNEGGAMPGAPASEGQNVGGAAPATNVGGGSGFVSGGSSGGGSSSIVTTLPVVPCSVITGHMRFGGINSTTEVTKLQTFLKNVEGINVNITGVYDMNTVEAVKTFQTKYASTVLAPWGTTIPTGNVLLTTLKQINARACNSVVILTQADLAQIEAAKSSVSISNEIGTNSSGTSTLANSSTSTNESQVGAVAKSSIASKIWKFIKALFGR